MKIIFMKEKVFYYIHCLLEIEGIACHTGLHEEVCRKSQWWEGWSRGEREGEREEREELQKLQMSAFPVIFLGRNGQDKVNQLIKFTIGQFE